MYIILIFIKYFYYFLTIIFMMYIILFFNNYFYHVYNIIF